MSLWKLLTAAYDSSGNNDKVRMDASTSALVGIDNAHHEIHEGDTFFNADVVDLAINNVRDIQITTPNTTKWGHFTFNFFTESETYWYLYENVTINTAGTAVNELNANRNSATTAGIVLAYIDNTSETNANADTATAGSTTLMFGQTGSGKQEPGHFEHAHEIILKQNEDYTLRFIAATAGFVSYNISWYEHEDNN